MKLIPTKIDGWPEMVMLPESVHTKSQTRKLAGKKVGKELVVPTVRWDDHCGNGHNSFSVTADIFEDGRDVGGGCCHEIIAKSHKELRHLIRWHLCSSNGPWGYIGNTIYQAGERDCWGLLKGEFRQHLSRGKHQAGGVEGVPCWELEKPESKEIYSHEKPEAVTLEWRPHGKTGDGKERELDHARESACWPEATDEQLMLPPEELKRLLIARLPALMIQMHKDITDFGFTY